MPSAFDKLLGQEVKQEEEKKKKLQFQTLTERQAGQKAESNPFEKLLTQRPPVQSQQPTQQPVVARARKIEGLIPLIGRKIEEATRRPEQEELGTDVFRNTLKFIPSAIVETILPAVGAVRDNPELASSLTNKDLLAETPKVATEVAKEFMVRFPVRGALNYLSIVGGPKTITIPSIGEISTNTARAVERVESGENPYLVSLQEGADAIFNMLFFTSIATKPFTPRQTTIATGVKTGTPSGRVSGPKSFRLYTPDVGVTQPAPRQWVESIVNDPTTRLRGKYNPELPTYFRVKEKGGGVYVGEIVQVKPSYIQTFFNKLKGDITKTPESEILLLAEKTTTNKDVVRAVEKTGIIQKVELAAAQAPKAQTIPVAPQKNPFTKLLPEKPTESKPVDKLVENYKATETAQQNLENILVELELSEKGSRVFVPQDRQGGTSEVIGMKSTFPEWVPEDLRSKSLFDSVLEKFTSDNVLDDLYVPDPKSKESRLLNVIMDELDARSGANTVSLRDDIRIEQETPIKSIQERKKKAISEKKAEKAKRAEEEITEEDVLKFFEVQEPKNSISTKESAQETIRNAESGLLFIEKNHPDSGVRAKANSALYELSKVESVSGRASVARSMRESFRKEFGVAKEAAKVTKPDTTLESEQPTKKPKIDTAKKERRSIVGAVSSTKEQPKLFSVGRFGDAEIKLSGVDDIKPIEFPELVGLAKELLGKVPTITKERFRPTFGGAPSGVFHADPLDPRVTLNPEIFADTTQATKTLAHELGHVIDWFPDSTLKRGNLLGRLQSLRNFLSSTLSKNGDALDVSEIRKQVTKLFKEKEDITWKEFRQKLKTDEKLRNEINDEVLKVIQEEHGIRNETIKKELEDLSNMWKPFDKSVGGSYVKYRLSPPELYADAISVLFNRPDLVKKMAPTFYEAFFEGIDTKPSVREAYFDLQEFLRGGEEAVVARRRKGVREMFKEGDQKAIDLEAKRHEESKFKLRNAGFWLKTELVDKNAIVIKKVTEMEKRGKFINEDDDPRYILEERNYLSGYIKGILQEQIQPIRDSLSEAGMSWDDLGEYTFYKRIVAGDRTKQANPRGITPEAAEKSLEDLKKQVGSENAKILETGAKNLRNFLIEINEKAYKSGLYSEKIFNQMKESPDYVTFQVIDFIEEGMTSSIHKSVGTLRDITNPATASIVKAIKVIQATERNSVVKSVVETYQKDSPNSIKPAKTRKIQRGKTFVEEPLESRLPNEELVTYRQDGKVKGFYVDSYTARSINNDSVGQNIAILKAIRLVNSSLFRPLFITYSLGFQSFNLFRDFFRYWKNIPDISMWQAFKRYKEALPVANARGFGVEKADAEAVALLEKLEKDRVLSITYNDFVLGQRTEENQLDAILKQYDIDYFTNVESPDKNFVKRIPRGLVNVFNFIKKLGDTIETLPKVAGYYELTQGGKTALTPSQRSYIRKNIGSPDFLAGGLVKPISNELFLFSNAIIQGMRSDINVAVGPNTRNAYWWKTAKLNLIPKILMFLASLGYFGKEVADLMNDASEYDKTNYTIIPIGRDTTGKTIYLRVPQDETGRFVGGTLWKIMSMFKNEQSFVKDLADVASYTGGQLPSPSPLFDVVSSAFQFASGKNPYDAFRGREVLSEEVFKAGGLPATKAYLGWLFQQVGGGVFYRFYHEPSKPREEGVVEKTVNLPVVGNVIGRFFRVSDYGQTERLREVIGMAQQEEARERLKRKEVIFDQVKNAIKDPENAQTYKQRMIDELYGGTPSTKSELSKYKDDIDKFNVYYKRGTVNDPNVEALFSATSNNQKAAVLRKIKSDMRPNEWAEFKNSLLLGDIVSTEVLILTEYEK